MQFDTRRQQQYTAAAGVAMRRIAMRCRAAPQRNATHPVWTNLEETFIGT